MMRTHLRDSLRIALLLGGIMSSSALAQKPDSGTTTKGAVTRADLNGRWSGTLVLDNSSPQLTLVFQANDSTLTGELLAEGRPFGPMTGLTFARDTVHFKVDVFDFTGVVKKASIAMDLIVYNGSVRKVTFTKE